MTRTVYWDPHVECHWCEREDEGQCAYECHPGQECVGKPGQEA